AMDVLIRATRKTPWPSRSNVALEYSTENTRSEAMIAPITMLNGEKRFPSTICRILLVAGLGGLLERPAACLAAASADDSPVMRALLLTLSIGVMALSFQDLRPLRHGLLNGSQDKDWRREALTVRATAVYDQPQLVTEN